MWRNLICILIIHLSASNLNAERQCNENIYLNFDTREYWSQKKRLIYFKLAFEYANQWKCWVGFIVLINMFMKYV